MWWTLFTIADLYIGVIVLDAMASSVPPEKLARLRSVRKVVLALLVASALVFIYQLARHYGWLRP